MSATEQSIQQEVATVLAHLVLPTYDDLVQITGLSHIEKKTYTAKRYIGSDGLAAEIDSQVKACAGCQKTFPFSSFNSCAGGRHGLHNHCRACQVISRKRYGDANREKERLATQARRSNPDYLRSELEKTKAKYHSDPEYRAELLAKNRIRRKNDKPRALANATSRLHAEANPSVKIARNMRARIRLAMLGSTRTESTARLIGCTFDELKNHLESLFEEGMTWQNYGYHGWHIDHIRPCASFDLCDELQQQLCFQYKNLQPMWRAENQSKGSSWLADLSKAA